MIPATPDKLSIDSALQQAIAHHQADRLREAEQLYRAVLQALPTQAEANHNLGILLRQQGQDMGSLRYLQAALVSNPAEPQYALSYADALLVTGQADKAMAVLQAAIQRGLNGEEMQSLLQEIEAAIQNDHASTATPPLAELHQLASLFNSGRYAELDQRAHMLLAQYPHAGYIWKVLGASLQMQGKDALSALQKAVELLPEDAEAHSNLGNTFQDLGQFANAVASYRRAVELKPDYAEAYSNLGNVLKDLGQLEAAAANYRHAIELKPDYAEAHSNLGNVLRDMGQFDRAVFSYRQALGLNPDYHEAYSNLGNALKDLGQLDDAVAHYQRALQTKPDYAEAHSNLGNALTDMRRFDDAVASYRRALELKPDYVEANSNLGNALQDLGQLEAAIASYRRALELKPDYAEAHSNLLFTLNYLPNQPAAPLLDEAKRYGELVARLARPFTAWRNVADPSRRLRVGLVSGDLRSHPVGYFVESVLSALTSQASQRIELFAYSSHFSSDAVTARIKSCCRAWHLTLGMSDESLAKRIHDDEIDILIDLSGHTAHNRLPVFAWKPAPVQVSWLGYFATTGVAAIDYLLADPVTLPESEERNFTEKIWRLPHTRLCFTPPDNKMEIGPLPALSNHAITFGCFSTLTKINDDVVALWARVLAAIPNSRLLLKAKQLDSTSARQNILARFAMHGIDATRLLMEGPCSRADYLAAYQRVDIMLDTFPFPGGTTTAEALWMGVPVLTLNGERFLARQGAGLLANAGLSEWVATSAENYVSRAQAHATDLQALASLRKGLRQQVLASPIFDATNFARQLEEALRGMWVNWCSGWRGGAT
jgi:predicted O-linked N-acetylglucosamine transferase (SPINDLY family)